MFKEILQIIPKLSPQDLNALEKALSSRFTTIAKKFGKGLLAALTGGGVAGVALGLIDKILNPLKETQEAIDRALKQGSDLVTNAKQFGTTAGKLFRLQQLGRSTGLDPEVLNVLLEKFQSAIAQAQADPTKPTSVRAFVGQHDQAEAFFQFIQSLQKLPKAQQLLVQQDVFGEKAILRMAQFLQTDFAKQTAKVGGPTSAQLTPGLEHLGQLNDLKDALGARRDLDDTLKKSKVITADMVKSQDQQLKLDLDKENKQIESYKNLAAIAIAANEIANLAKNAVLQLTALVVKITDLSKNVEKLTNSRAVKGIMKWIGGVGGGN